MNKDSYLEISIDCIYYLFEMQRSRLGPHVIYSRMKFSFNKPGA